MKIAGQAVLHAPVEQVWDALLDPAVLVRTIPGCESLETIGENQYAMTVTAGVASVRGTYAGQCSLHDLVANRSLRLSAQGAGAPGTVSTDVEVSFADLGDGTTEVGYSADADVGGMVGGVGQRMLTGVSKRMAGEFFAAVEDVIAAGSPSVASQTTGPGRGQVYAAPPRARTGGESEFVKGVALGGALVLAGALAGALVGRRRR